MASLAPSTIGSALLDDVTSTATTTHWIDHPNGKDEPLKHLSMPNGPFIKAIFEKPDGSGPYKKKMVLPCLVLADFLMRYLALVPLFTLHAAPQLELVTLDDVDAAELGLEQRQPPPTSWWKMDREAHGYMVDARTKGAVPKSSPLERVMSLVWIAITDELGWMLRSWDALVQSIDRVRKANAPPSLLGRAFNLILRRSPSLPVLPSLDTAKLDNTALATTTTLGNLSSAAPDAGTASAKSPEPEVASAVESRPKLSHRRAVSMTRLRTSPFDMPSPSYTAPLRSRDDTTPPLTFAVPPHLVSVQHPLNPLDSLPQIAAPSTPASFTRARTPRRGSHGGTQSPRGPPANSSPFPLWSKLSPPNETSEMAPEANMEESDRSECWSNGMLCEDGEVKHTASMETNKLVFFCDDESDSCDDTPSRSRPFGGAGPSFHAPTDKFEISHTPSRKSFASLENLSSEYLRSQPATPLRQRQSASSIRNTNFNSAHHSRENSSTSENDIPAKFSFSRRVSTSSFVGADALGRSAFAATLLRSPASSAHTSSDTKIIQRKDLTTHASVLSASKTGANGLDRGVASISSEKLNYDPSSARATSSRTGTSSLGPAGSSIVTGNCMKDPEVRPSSSSAALDVRASEDDRGDDERFRNAPKDESISLLTWIRDVSAHRPPQTARSTSGAASSARANMLTLNPTAATFFPAPIDSSSALDLTQAPSYRPDLWSTSTANGVDAGTFLTSSSAHNHSTPTEVDLLHRLLEGQDLVLRELKVVRQQQELMILHLQSQGYAPFDQSSGAAAQEQQTAASPAELSASSTPKPPSANRCS